MHTLEEVHDCRIQFIGVDTRYPDDWEVRIDGTPVLEIGRHRDESGNTVYEMTSEAFLEAIQYLFLVGFARVARSPLLQKSTLKKAARSLRLLAGAVLVA